MFRNALLQVGWFLIFMTLCARALSNIEDYAFETASDASQVREMQYLPSGKGLRLLSFGYSNTLSHVLWFNTISYFGKHHRSDQNYRWLAHMCNLVTDLNPRARHVFEFCSTMLAWEAKLPEESIQQLSKAIRHSPDDWYLYYQRGFVYMFFMQDSERAQTDFVKSASLPSAHWLVKRLAAKKLAASDNVQAAIDILSDMLRREQDPVARTAIESRLQELRSEH